MRISMLLLLAGIARADATLPGDEPAMSADENEVAVKALPEEGTLKLTMDEHTFQGCSRSFHSTTVQRQVTLELHRKDFTLSADGNRTQNTGGWDPHANQPRASSSRSDRVSWRASGRAERHDGVLELVGKTALGEAVTVRCQLRSVERELPNGQRAGHLSALVCDVPAVDAFSNHGGAAGETVGMPLGRTTTRVDGLKASLSSHYTRPPIAVAPLIASR
jgi:hypothetical protein